MPESNDDITPSNSQFRSTRREAKKRPQRKTVATRRRGRERNLSVRSALRETPDVHKIARAVIAMALAQAEADAAAQAQPVKDSGAGSASTSRPQSTDDDPTTQSSSEGAPRV